MIDWLLRNRTTGRITVVQFPNAPLWLFLAASAGQRLVDPAGRIHEGLRVLAAGSLLWWAADELVRGVNPFRRLLGATVLAGQVLHLLR